MKYKKKYEWLIVRQQRIKNPSILIKKIINYNPLTDKDSLKLLFHFHFATNAKYRKFVNEFYFNKKNKGKSIPLRRKDVNLIKCFELFEDLLKRLKDPKAQFIYSERFILDFQAKAILSEKLFKKYEADLEERRKNNPNILHFFEVLHQPFHFPQRGPHGFWVATALYFLTSNGINWLWFSGSHGSGTFFCFIFLIYFISYWFRDISVEGGPCGLYSKYDDRNLKFGFQLFLISETMLFGSFFWAFFHSSLSPAVGIGFMYPPSYITPIPWWTIPGANTIILVASSFIAAALNISMCWKINVKKPSRNYFAIVLGREQGSAFFKKQVISVRDYLLAEVMVRKLDKNGIILIQFMIGIWKILLFHGLAFLILQFIEFYKAPFNINTSVYGSCFFMITGLHCFHVMAGLAFLFVQYCKFFYGYFRSFNKLGVQMALWYWHFVDIIWILVYVWVYIWGS